MHPKKLFFMAVLLCLGWQSVNALPTVVVRDNFFTPAQPIEGLPITWSGDLVNECFLPFPGPAPNAQGDSFWVTREGDQLHLFIVRADLGPAPCILPPDFPANFTPFELGALEEGDYVLNVYAVFNDVVFPVEPSNFEVAFERSFSVQDGANPVPVLNRWGLAVFLLILSIVAWHRIRLRATK